MHLGKFRVKRTLFGLIFTIGFLSVVKIVKEPTSRPKSINFKFLRYKFDANLPQNGDRRAPKRDHNLNPQVNITNSRKVKEVPSTPSDGRNEEDQVRTLYTLNLTCFIFFKSFTAYIGNWNMRNICQTTVKVIDHLCLRQVKLLIIGVF